MEEPVKIVKDNPAILVSAYAALISTIALVWNIINSILSKVDRISVNARFNTTYAYGDNNEFIEGPLLLVVSIVNEAKRIKYIKIPTLKLSYHHGNKINKDSRDDIVNLHYKSNKIKYPFEIKPESEVTLEFPIGAGSDWFLNNSKKSSNFRVIITDTVNKKYKSKKLKLIDLRHCIEHNSKLSTDVLKFFNENYLKI